MANSTIPNLAAVTVPALTDLFGVRQSGDTRDKKLTVTQLLTLIPSGGDVTKVGTPVNNQVGVWTGDGTIEGDAGFTWDGATLFTGNLVLGGAAGSIRIFEAATDNVTFRMSGNSIYLMDLVSFRTSSSTGGGVAVGPASATVPTLLTRNGDTNTGLGGTANDTLSIIAGGVEMIKVQEVPGATQSIFSPAGAQNDEGNPTIALGDGDTGFFEGIDDRLHVSVGGTAGFLFQSDEFRAASTRSAQMRNVTASATVPAFSFQSDNDTGIGSAALDQVSIIAGGDEIARAVEVVGANQFILTPGLIDNNPAAPTLAFGDGDTGFYENADDFLSVAVAGVRRFAWSTTAFSGVTVGSASLINEVASATNPTLVPNGSNDNTGIGSAAADQLSLIAGGVELLRISDDASAFILAGTNAAADGGDLDLSSGDSGVGATGNAGAVNILAGESLATTGDGGVVSIKSGAGFFQGAGGDILIEVGEGGAAGPGTSGNLFINTLTGANAAAGLQVPIPGLVSIFGIGRSGEGAAGNLELWGGYAAGTGGASAGGDAIMWGGGQGGGSGVGGAARLIGGESEDNPGDVEIRGGQATVGGIGGDALVNGGTGFNNASGGGVVIRGGTGAGTGNGGQSNLIGGQSGNGATGVGGNVEVVAGASVATNGDGGDAVLGSGVGAGSGADGDILLNIGAAGQFVINVAQGIAAVNAGGPAILNEAASSTNPTILPNRSDDNTGLGRSPADILHLIAGGVEGIRVEEVASAIFIELFGRTTVTGNLILANSAGPTLLNEAASSTNPTLIPNKADDNTGIGSAAADQLDLIAGGLSCMSVRETAAARQIGFYTTAPISQQTGVAVSSAGIHAALVALGLITA